MSIDEYTSHHLLAQDPAAPLPFSAREIMDYLGLLPLGEWSAREVDYLYARAVQDYLTGCADVATRRADVALDACGFGAVRAADRFGGSVSAFSQRLARARRGQPRYRGGRRTAPLRDGVELERSGS
jgi:hypothetical protein